MKLVVQHIVPTPSSPRKDNARKSNHNKSRSEAWSSGAKWSSSSEHPTDSKRHGPSSSQFFVDQESKLASAPTDQQIPNHRLFVKPSIFVVSWWIVLLFHACDFAFLVAVARLYYWLLNTPLATENLLRNLNFELSHRTLGILNWFFVALAVLHGIRLMSVITYSIMVRELTFSKPLALSSATSAVSRARGEDAQEPHFVVHYWNKLVVKRWKRFFDKYIIPVFCIRGVHFDEYFLFREYIEVASQIYQAYYMSIYVATRWINNVFVMLIFLNCVSTPLIRLLLPSSKKPFRRLISLIISTLLNFINSVVIPLIIFMPYVRALDPDTLMFAYKYSFDDIWYLNSRLENQQLFVTSYADFLTTLTPHWSLFSCLWTCENMLKSTANLSAFQIKVKRRKDAVLYNLLWLSGVVILVIHIVAQLPERIDGCRLQASPWFGTKSACVVMNVNCYRSGIDGELQEMNRELIKLDQTTLSSLIFSHCRNLHVTPLLQSFHSLAGFEIYNSTIRQWSDDAAITGEHHPRIDYINVLRSRLSGLPDGLLSEQFPREMWEVDFYETNLTTLPADLHKKWTNLQTLVFELCAFTEIPLTIYEMPQKSIELRFGGNPIRSIDDRIFELDSLRGLRLFNTSLQEFPSTAASTQRMEKLVMLDLRFTQLTQVPVFVRNWYQDMTSQGKYLQHSLFGSPYCLPSRAQELDDQLEQEYREQVCQPNPELNWSSFPIELIEPQRQP